MVGVDLKFEQLNQFVAPLVVVLQPLQEHLEPRYRLSSFQMTFPFGAIDNSYTRYMLALKHTNAMMIKNCGCHNSPIYNECQFQSA